MKAFAGHSTWIRRLVMAERWPLLFYFLLELTGIALSLLFVYFSKEAIDRSTGPDTGGIRLMVAAVVLTAIGGVLVRSYSGWLSARVRMRMLYSLQLRVADAQLLSEWEAFKDRHSGDVQLRIQSDADEAVGMLAYSGLAALLTLVRLGASFIFLWLMEPTLAWIILAITPLFLLSKIYFHRLKRLTAEVKRQESNFASVLAENLRLRTLIRAMDIYTERRGKLEESQEKLVRLKSDQLSFSTWAQGGMKLTLNVGYLLTFIWGIYRLHAGVISFGTLAAFLQLAGRIQTPLVNLMGFFPQFVRFKVAVNRIDELLQQPAESVQPGKQLHDLRCIRMERLSFRYDQQWILKDLDLEIKRGAPLAVTGATGKGKTTLIRLLLGMIKPEEGRILVESPESFQQLEAAHRINFLYVPQGNSLFSGTILDNLMVYASHVSAEKIQEILWVACAEFVNNLPQGVHTRVGESGFGLSEGQAQRIAIARALMQDRPVWLFDEVTSALDQETKTLLVERLLTWGKNKLCIFVTHDVFVMEQCSRIFKM